MTEEALIQCPLCGHAFGPGRTEGYVYCSACGRRFNPSSPFEDTAIIPAPAGADPEEGEDDALAPDPPSPPHHSTSRRFGEYDLLEEIARGGMGVVYLARQRVLKRVVALKVLRSGDNASTEERERLLREAKAAAGLSHPNIVPIHEFSIHQGQPYFTMDFIEGQPLDRLLEKGPLNIRKAVDIIETMARAIAYAHSRGIIHRDIKPGNILITREDRPMITDFGLAVELLPEGERRRRMTMAGAVMGTIPYAPPEQASGKIDQITERSDVYSMGAVLYELVTGRQPFTGFTQFELMRRVINQDPVPPRRINPKVHRDVETIILKCLEKDPRRRYVTAKAFADDCQSFLKGEVIAARPATLDYRLRRAFARRPFMTFLSACVAVLLLALWFGIGHFRILAKEMEATEQALESSLANAERIALEKAETERQVQRAWRAEYNLNFDYAFRWESDIERSRRLEIPWLAPQRARLLSDPPRLALADAGKGGRTPSSPGNAGLGFPFVFPREARVTLRLHTPDENVGELMLMLDVDASYDPHPGTTIARFGSPGHPGAAFYRGEAMIDEDPAYSLKPGAVLELAVERSDGRIRAYQDGRVVLEAEDPPPVLAAEGGRITLDVHDGTLEFFDLAVEVRSMSPSLMSGLVETANTMAARGRPDLALRLYANVLLEPTDPQNRLLALRGYARSLWVGLPRRERGAEGFENAVRGLYEQMKRAGQVNPGEIEYLLGLAMSFNFSSEREGLAALERLDRAAAVAYSEGGDAGQYGDLARLEALFIYIRLGMLNEAARRFNFMYGDGATRRLHDRFGAALGGGGQAALILEKVDPLLKAENSLPIAATLLRAVEEIAPSSRECAQRIRRLAQIYAQRNEPDMARNYLHMAEKITPDWHRPYLDEAIINFNADLPVQADDALNRARTAIPQSLDLHLGIAKLFLDDLPAERQNPEAAEKAARAAVDISQGKNPQALEADAAALLRLNRPAEALECIDGALKLEKNDARQALREKILQQLSPDAKTEGQ